MIGLDTNVLVRYLVRDNEAQFQVACRVIDGAAEGEGVSISLPVLLECEWVLRSRYKFKKDKLVALFDALLSKTDIGFDDEMVVEAALKGWKDSAADFADCLIVAAYLKAGCASVATFDRKAGALPGTILLRT